MIAGNGQANPPGQQWFEPEFLERVCFERWKDDRNLQAAIAHSGDVFSTGQSCTHKQPIGAFEKPTMSKQSPEGFDA